MFDLGATKRGPWNGGIGFFLLGGGRTYEVRVIRNVVTAHQNCSFREPAGRLSKHVLENRRAGPLDL